MAKATPEKPDSTPVEQPATSGSADAIAIGQAIAAALAQHQPSSGVSADQLERILSNSTQSVQKALKPENASAPNVSAFNPTGGEKPTLHAKGPDGTLRARKTYFIGQRMHEDQLTPAEIELFNRFVTNKTARNGLWTATIRQNGNDQELHVFVPNKEINDRMDLPNGLSLILRELLDGPDAANPESLSAIVERQQMELDALKRQMATA